MLLLTIPVSQTYHPLLLLLLLLKLFNILHCILPRFSFPLLQQSVSIVWLLSMFSPHWAVLKAPSEEWLPFFKLGDSSNPTSISILPILATILQKQREWSAAVFKSHLRANNPSSNRKRKKVRIENREGAWYLGFQQQELFFKNSAKIMWTCVKHWSEWQVPKFWTNVIVNTFYYISMKSLSYHIVIIFCDNRKTAY